MSEDRAHPRSTRPTELPLVGGPPAERADAARNRRKILAAAQRLVAARGVAALSMDEVARLADVGIGTVYRRFGDLAGLAYALLDERERAFQDAFINGPPPLGPGAPPAERIRAFLHALLDHVVEQGELLVISESKARLTDAPYRVRRAHLAALLRAANPRLDAEYLADALLAPLAASFVAYELRDQGMTKERIKAGLDALVGSLPLGVDSR